MANRLFDADVHGTAVRGVWMSLRRRGALPVRAEQLGRSSQGVRRASIGRLVLHSLLILSTGLLLLLVPGLKVVWRSFSRRRSRYGCEVGLAIAD
jgi:hypothetical protein